MALSGKNRSVTDFGESVRGRRMGVRFAGNGMAVLAVMDAVAAETGGTLAQIALAWLAAQDAVTAPIASATDVTQVEDLLGAMRLKLSAEQVDRLNTAGA